MQENAIEWLSTQKVVTVTLGNGANFPRHTVQKGATHDPTGSNRHPQVFRNWRQ